MDIKKDFTDSFELLKRHREVVLPVLIALVIPIFLMGAFFEMSGLKPLTKELYQHKQNFDKMREGQTSWFADENELFVKYLEEQEFGWEKLKTLATSRNLWLLVGFMFFGILSSFYFSCMSYAMIALSIQNKKMDGLISLTNRFAVKLFSMKIIIMLIVAVPLAALTALAVLAFFVHVALGAISLLFLTLVFIAYIVLVNLRLFFRTPAMFVDNQGPIDSLRHSYHLTKSHIWQVLLIFFVLWAISSFTMSFISEPLKSALSGYVFMTGNIALFFNLLFIIVFLLIEAVAFTLEHIFFFYSYIDFKKEVKDG